MTGPRPLLVRPVARPHRFHSVSSCGKYLECPKAFDFAYLQKLPPDKPVPEHWRYGTVAHKGLEVAVLDHIERKGTGSLADTVPAAVAAVEAEFAKLDLDQPGELDRLIESVTESLHGLDFDASNVLGVEQKFLGTTPDGARFVGFADLVLRLGPTSLEVRDYKNRSKAASPEQLAVDFQLNLYGHFARQEWPWAKVVYASHFYPPTQKLVRVQLTDESMEAAVERFEAIVEMCEGDTELAPRKGSHCSYCQHREKCPAWQVETTSGSVPDDQFNF